MTRHEKLLSKFLSRPRDFKYDELIRLLKALGYARLFSKFHPGHIHVHFLSWPSTLGMVASILLNVPYSISGHARDVMVDGSLIPSKVKTAKFISICNKYAYRSCIEKSGVKFPTNIYQQYHGVDASKISLANPKMHKPERAFVFVGSRLVEKKGLSYVISASKLLKQRGIAHEIHIAGPGPLYKTLLEQIKQEGVEDTVEIHGEGKGVPWDDILEFYKVADVFAHPSIDTDIGDVDGVPTFVIEAALAKVPIVTTSVGSITDLITHEETGILVPQKDPRALADGIEKMIFDEGLRKRLIDNAYAKAREMFDLDKNVKALEDLLLK